MRSSCCGTCQLLLLPSELPNPGRARAVLPAASKGLWPAPSPCVAAGSRPEGLWLPLCTCDPADADKVC